MTAREDQPRLGTCPTCGSEKRNWRGCLEPDCGQSQAHVKHNDCTDPWHFEAEDQPRPTPPCPNLWCVLGKDHAGWCSPIAMFLHARVEAQGEAPQVDTVAGKDWDSLLLEIAKVYALIDDEWADAGLGEMDEFDPWHALREINKRMQVRVETGAHPSRDARTDKDYAIEHGGYLATAAENYMQAINQYSAGEVDSDYLSDHWRALQSAVGEFRKRAKRATGGSTPSLDPSWLDTELWNFAHATAIELGLDNGIGPTSEAEKSIHHAMRGACIAYSGRPAPSPDPPHEK